MYRIIFRSCDIVNSVHNTPRVFGLDKQTIIKACFYSLYKSMQGFEHTIDIVGDRLSNEMLEFFQKFPDVRMHNYTEELGNHESIRTTFRLALTFDDNDWVFFCEDDYLFTTNAITIIDAMVQERKSVLELKNPLIFPNIFIGKLEEKPLLIFPSDQPSYYTKQRKNYSLVFATSNSYWRQIPTVTFTYLIEGKNVQKYYDLFYRTSFGANDFYLSEALFGKWLFKFRPFLSITPMPSVSAHLHEGVLSPFLDWESIMNSAIDGYKEFIGSTFLETTNFETK